MMIGMMMTGTKIATRPILSEECVIFVITIAPKIFPQATMERRHAPVTVEGTLGIVIREMGTIMMIRRHESP